MKISKVEFVTILLASAVLSFTAGWLFRAASSAEPVRIETERNPDAGQVVIPAMSQLPAAQAQSEPAAVPAGGFGALVNINTADSETLQTLPGIGAKRAGDIIAYREANGPFQSPEELVKVSGIGPSLLEELRELITA